MVRLKDLLLEKKLRVLDFDDTLATTESLVKYTTPDGKTGTLNAEQFASTYQDLQDQGYVLLCQAYPKSDLKIVVEARDLDEIQEILHHGGDRRRLIDNFGIHETKMAVKLIGNPKNKGGVLSFTLDGIRGSGALPGAPSPPTKKIETKIRFILDF